MMSRIARRVRSTTLAAPSVNGSAAFTTRGDGKGVSATRLRFSICSGKGISFPPRNQKSPREFSQGFGFYESGSGLSVHADPLRPGQPGKGKVRKRVAAHHHVFCLAQLVAPVKRHGGSRSSSLTPALPGNWQIVKKH